MLLNYLIPGGKAYEATKGNLKHIEVEKGKSTQEANETESDETSID